jgi:hypothetical protein
MIRLFHKSKVLKYLDDIEKKLITEVGSVQEKNEEKINREKHEICQLTSTLKDNLSSIEFYLLMLCFHWFIFNRTRSGNLWQWSDCFNVDILNFFKLHVNFIVESVQEKHEEKINKEKHEICQLTSILKDNKQELEFLKDHGSNNQLFLIFFLYRPYFSY